MQLNAEGFGRRLSAEVNSGQSLQLLGAGTGNLNAFFIFGCGVGEEIVLHFCGQSVI